MTTQNTLTISQLFIYPVKSLRGIALSQSTLLSSGLPFDRYWMIVDESGQFISQRQHAQMALINTAIDNEKLTFAYKDKSISIDINTEVQTTPFTATVWQDSCQVVAENKAVNTWLSDILGQSVKLVRMLDSFTRPQSKSEIYGQDTYTYFADAAPYLLCNQGSLDHINQLLEIEGAPPLSIKNFRPNIVVAGIEPFAEHKIKTLINPSYELECRYPCQRCAIPNIDINTAEKRLDRQPYKILGEKNPMPNGKNLPAFGENVTLNKGINALIKVGDKLEYRYE